MPASSRSTNGSRGQGVYRDSSLTAILGPTPVYPNLIPASEIGSPFEIGRRPYFSDEGHQGHVHVGYRFEG